MSVGKLPLRVVKAPLAAGIPPLVKTRQPMAVAMAALLVGKLTAFVGASPMVKKAQPAAARKPAAGVGQVPTFVGKPPRGVVELTAGTGYYYGGRCSGR